MQLLFAVIAAALVTLGLGIMLPTVPFASSLTIGVLLWACVSAGAALLLLFLVKPLRPNGWWATIVAFAVWAMCSFMGWGIVAAAAAACTVGFLMAMIVASLVPAPLGLQPTNSGR